MISRKTLILSIAIAVVATVPAVAWAVGDPFGNDPRPPTVGGDAETDAPYGWMGQMHDYMWNDGELPEDFPTDQADWMNQMHADMWGDAPADGSFGWMGQMHDYMWNDGELPEDFPTDQADWMNQMHADMWGDAPADGSFGWMGQMHDYMWNDGELPEDGPARGGCGMWTGRWRSETTPGTGTAAS